MNDFIKSRIITEHIDGCAINELKQKGEVPTEWDVMHPVMRTCNHLADVVSPEEAAEIGVTAYYMEFKCPNPKCNAVKRVKLSEIANV